MAERAPARTRSKTKEVKKDGVTGKSKRKKEEAQSGKSGVSLWSYRKFVHDHANHRAVGDSLSRIIKYHEHAVNGIRSVKYRGQLVLTVNMYVPDRQRNGEYCQVHCYSLCRRG